MSRMRAANRGNVAGVAGCGQPVADRGTNGAALDRSLIGLRRLTGNQEKNARSRGDRLVEAGIEERIGRIEIVAMKINNKVGLHQPAR